MVWFVQRMETPSRVRLGQTLRPDDAAVMVAVAGSGLNVLPLEHRRSGSVGFCAGPVWMTLFPSLTDVAPGGERAVGRVFRPFVAGAKTESLLRKLRKKRGRL